MAKGIISLRNSSGGGGISSVPARIICDTTNLQTTDAVRVQSMTNPTSVETVDVVTPGEYLIFDVDGRDYYKISLVQEIDNEDVEMVSVYRTLGFGEATVVNVFDKTHLSGIQAILNSHTETDLLAVGDEVTVNISGVDEIYIIAGLNIYGTHEAIFISKYTSYSASGLKGADYATANDLNIYLTSVYTTMNSTDRALLKNREVQYVNGSVKYITQNIWIPSRQEVFGDLAAESASIYLPYFQTSSNRIKKQHDGSNASWALRTSQTVYTGYSDYVATNGVINYTNGAVSVITSFHLTADI